MAKLSSSLSLCLWLCFSVLGSCLAHRRQPQQNECQLEKLEALEPDNVIKSEAGRIETWNPNHKQFQCAGVALSRFILERHALRMPSYTNSPHLIFIRRGRGLVGMVFPGCPATYEEPQESQSGKRRLRDHHQKIRQFRAGDIIAVPTGIAYWMYNYDNEPVEAISLLDTSSSHNQLDRIPRIFYLAGNQEQEFLQYQEEQEQQQEQQQQQQQRSRREGQQGRRGQQQEQEEQQQGRRGQQQEQEEEQQQQSGNLLAGFGEELLAQALNVDKETARKIQGRNDRRPGSIVRVKGGLSILRAPPRKQQHQQQEEEEEEEDEDQEQQQQQQQQRERQQERRSRGGREEESQGENGLEETVCTMRLRQNIGKSTAPDIYNPRAGSLRTVNSLDLPVLGWLGLSAEYGSLHENATLVPQYNINAHSILCALEGRAQVQVVDCSGSSVYNQELEEGQALTVPQNYAVAIKSQSEHFLYVAFKTNDRAMVATLPQQIQAWPEEVVAEAYQLKRHQARQLKKNSPHSFLVPPQQSQDEMRAVA